MLIINNKIIYDEIISFNDNVKSISNGNDYYHITNIKIYGIFDVDELKKSTDIFFSFNGEYYVLSDCILEEYNVNIKDDIYESNLKYYVKYFSFRTKEQFGLLINPIILKEERKKKLKTILCLE